MYLHHLCTFKINAFHIPNKLAEKLVTHLDYNWEIGSISLLIAILQRVVILTRVVNILVLLSMELEEQEEN